MRDNQPRRHEQAGVESWFLRANHPTEPRAIWLKATTFVDNNGAGVAEVWCSVFDGDRTWASKRTEPKDSAKFRGDPIAIDVGGCRFDLDPEGGRLHGELKDGDRSVAWDLTIRRDPVLGDPLCMLPTRRLVDAAIPKNKLLTPAPALRFDGEIIWDGVQMDVTGWRGSQGHNWGDSHAKEYAWGQCLFLDPDGEPFCFVEGASGRIVVGGRTTPILSLMTVRRGDREYRFDRILDLWNQTPDIAFPRWTLRMRGRDGEATLAVEAQPSRMVCLGYHNPAGDTSYCLNSKTAAATLRVNPVNEDAFECVSEHGAALEFLQPTADPRVQPVI